MADEGDGKMSIERDGMIAQIRAMQDELARLGVRREYINFRRLKDEELAEEFDAVFDQLKQRKKFLEVN